VTADPDATARRALLEVVRELDQRDTAPDVIVDALLALGITAAVRLIGKEAAATLLEEMASDLRRDGSDTDVPQ
jgi:hypothetical protein